MQEVSPAGGRRLIKLLALAVSLLLIVSVAPGARQSRAPLAGSASAALKATNDVLKVVSRLRGLEIKEPVKSGVKTHDEIEQYVIRDLDDSTTPEEFEATSKTLTKMGLLPRGFQLRDYVVKLLREQVAGFYEPKTKEFYLAEWLPISEQKTVMAHELTHALQDQHFNLRRFERWPKGDADAELALHALVEGEATIVMFEYAAEEEGMHLDVTKLGSLTEKMLQQDESADASRYPVLSRAPAVLRENLQFPYVYGVGFVQEVLKNRTWQALNLSYTNLPASSEQIMHPARFLQRDDPVKIQIQDLSPALGADWNRADEDVNGEFGYLVLLEEFIGRKAAAVAAEGWGGDRYVLYENKRTGDLLLAEYTTWDTARDAGEFFDAYCRRTEKRYGLERPARETRGAVAEPGIRAYSTTEGLVQVELRDKDVAIIEGVANRDLLRTLSSLLWQSKRLARPQAN